MRRRIRLTESDLNRIVRESVRRIVESSTDDIERLNQICDDFLYNRPGYLSVDDCRFLIYLGNNNKMFRNLGDNGVGRPYEKRFCNYLIDVRKEDPERVNALKELIPKWSEKELDPDAWNGMHGFDAPTY